MCVAIHTAGTHPERLGAHHAFAMSEMHAGRSFSPLRHSSAEGVPSVGTPRGHSHLTPHHSLTLQLGDSNNGSDRAMSPAHLAMQRSGGPFSPQGGYAGGHQFSPRHMAVPSGSMSPAYGRGSPGGVLIGSPQMSHGAVSHLQPMPHPMSPMGPGQHFSGGVPPGQAIQGQWQQGPQGPVFVPGHPIQQGYPMPQGGPYVMQPHGGPQVMQPMLQQQPSGGGAMPSHLGSHPYPTSPAGGYGPSWGGAGTPAGQPQGDGVPHVLPPHPQAGQYRGGPQYGVLLAPGAGPGQPTPVGHPSEWSQRTAAEANQARGVPVQGVAAAQGGWCRLRTQG
jgi:hypothetical protein